MLRFLLRTSQVLATTGLLASLGCGPGPADLTSVTALPLASLDAAGERDLPGEICKQRVAAALAAEAAPGAPGYDQKRVEILGRAVGEPALFVHAPKATTNQKTKARNDAMHHHRLAIRRTLAAHRLDKPKARAELLKSDYVYSESPNEAMALVRELTFHQLFDEPEILVQRGENIHALKRVKDKRGRGHYHYKACGNVDGKPRTLCPRAKLLLFDRAAVERTGLERPLHRDLVALRDRGGFDRIKPIHVGEKSIVADLRFGEQWQRALIGADGAKLELSCLDAPPNQRQATTAWLAKTASKRRAQRQLRDTLARMVEERLPFDRPHGAKDHFSDGQLRPSWEWAYRRGNIGFMHDGNGYAVFDELGRPRPPQMCVELILDSYERASGTWYGQKRNSRERNVGGLDFNALGIHNRAGVMAFEQFAIKKPELFESRRFKKRVPLKNRKKFFAFMLQQAEQIESGDVVTIQGPKRDGYIHQHAILIADVDPITGFAYRLADQMKWPRYRTWEGIMAEAPLRAPIYHIRLRPNVLARLDPQRSTVPSSASPSSDLPSEDPKPTRLTASAAPLP